MSWPLARKRDMKRWAATAGAAATVACTAASSPAPNYSIPLPPGVDSVPSRFIGSVGPRRGPPHERPRPGDCSQCVVIVHIEVLSDTRLINPEVPPAQGVAIAHLVNTDDTDEEAYYKLLPHTQAEYYVWVDNGGGKTRATLLEVTPAKVKAKKQWNIILCHPYSATNLPGDPDFDFYEYRHGTEKCTARSTVNTPQVNYASVFTAAPFQSLFAKIMTALHGNMSALRGDWIECSSGCCT
jgi:hypothetical protein